jgi:hypothetical protein
VGEVVVYIGEGPGRVMGDSLGVLRKFLRCCLFARWRQAAMGLAAEACLLSVMIFSNYSFKISRYEKESKDSNRLYI